MADGSPKTAIDLDLEPAFAAVYRQHAEMVRRALRQLGVAPASLDDAVQDVFVVLHRRIDEYERGRSLKNWLWGIARGVASGYRRSERRRDRLHAALPAPEGTGPLERGVARREAADILDDFLGSLDADKCAVFVLSELEGRRGPEIAEQLQVNLNTVYARLRAARQRFDAALVDLHQRDGEPARQPLFAAWLGWAWPTWLGKPAAAVSVAALAGAVVVVPAAVERSSLRAADDAVVTAEAEPAIAATVAREGSRRGSQPRVVDEPALDDDEIVVLDDDEIVVLDEPTSARPRARSTAPASMPAEPSDDVMLLDDSLEPAAPLAIAEPAAAPWSTTVDARRPVRHPSLLALRQDFIAELLRVATEL